MTQIFCKSNRHGVLAALILLLVGQIGAQWHSYAHAAGGSREVRSQPVLAVHGDCTDCLGFAPLLAAAGTPAALPPVATRLHTGTASVPLVSLLDYGLILAFRSRAPPR